MRICPSLVAGRERCWLVNGHIESKYTLILFGGPFQFTEWTTTQRCGFKALNKAARRKSNLGGTICVSGIDEEVPLVKSGTLAHSYFMADMVERKTPSSVSQVIQILIDSLKTKSQDFVFQCAEHVRPILAPEIMRFPRFIHIVFLWESSVPSQIYINTSHAATPVVLQAFLTAAVKHQSINVSDV